MNKNFSYHLRAFSLLLMFSLGTFPWLSGQNALSLDECIQLAQDRSPEASIARKGYEAVYWSYKSYRAGLLPQIGLDINSPGLVRSISQITLPDGTQTFLQQNQAFSSAALQITQEIAPTGGSVFLTSGLNRLDVFGGAATQQYSSTPMLVGFNQPLFAFNPLKWEKRSQPLQFLRAEKQYLEALEDIAVDICGKYFDVYISQLRLENVERNTQVNDSIYTISKGRFKVGKIAENDLLQTELAALNAQASVRDAELALQKAQTDLAIALGLPDGSLQEVNAPLSPPRAVINPEFAIDQARSSRSNAIDFDLRRLNAERDLANAKADARFSASLNATFGLNQTGPTLRDAYVDPLDQQTASLRLSVPIVQWGRGKARVESAQLERDRVDDQIQLEQRILNRDVRFQVLDFTQLQDRYLLAVKANDIAERRFQVAKNRYLVGKIDITNLQIAQGEKDDARASFFQTLRQYWVAYYQLRRSTLYDFSSDLPLEAPDLSRR